MPERLNHSKTGGRNGQYRAQTGAFWSADWLAAVAFGEIFICLVDNGKLACQMPNATS